MNNNEEDLIEVKNKVVGLLNRQTIGKMQKYMKNLNIKIPGNVKEGRKNFFLTDKRKQILKGINDHLSNGEKIISIHGEYGTGKSTLCQNLPMLCESGQELDGEKLPRFKFKNKNIKPIYIHLVRTKKLGEFLKKLLQDLSHIYEKDNIIQSYNDVIKKEEDLNEKTRNKLSQAEKVNDITKNLIKDIKNVERAWIIEEILNKLKNEKNIPMIILDEFESLIRNKTELLGFIRNLTRDQMEENNINSILFISSVRYEDIKGLEESENKGELEDDWFDRLGGFETYRLDPTPEEARKIMKKIYRYYVVPILEGYMQEGKNIDFWIDKIDNKNKIFPISEYVQTYLTENALFLEDDKYVKNFRTYKKIIRKLIDIWEFDNDGNGVDKKYFWDKSEEIRPDISEMKGVLMDRIPSRNLIRKLINNLFPDCSLLQQDTIFSILEKLIIEDNETGSVHIPKRDLENFNLDGFEDVDRIFKFLSNSEVRYFEVNEEEKVISISIDDLLDKVKDIGKSPKRKPITEVLAQKFKDKNFNNWEILELWEKRVNSSLKTSLSEDEDKLIVHTNESFLSNIYITTKEEILAQIKDEDSFNNKNNIQLAILIEFEDEEKYVNFKCISNLKNNELDNKIEKYINRQYRYTYDKDYTKNPSDKKKIGLINELEDNYNGRAIGKKYLKLLLLSRIVDKEVIKEKIKGRFAVPSKKSLKDFKCRGVGEKWAVSRIGFAKVYKSNRLCDLVFALKKSSKNQTRNILCDTPYDEKVDYIKSSFGRKYTTQPEFNNFIKGFAKNNEFLKVKEEEVIIPDYDYFPRKWKGNMNKIESLLENNEGEIKFLEIKEKLFDCSLSRKIDYHIYTFLVIEKCRETIVLKNEDKGDLDDLEILDPETSLEKQKERLKEKLDQRCKENLIKSTIEQKRKQKLREISKAYKDLEEKTNVSDLRPIKNIATEVVSIKETKQECNLKISDLEVDITASILKAFGKYKKRDKIYTILFESIIKEMMNDLKMELSHKEIKEKIKKLISDLEKNDIMPTVKACPKSQNLEKKISEKIPEKVWYDDNIKEMTNNIGELFENAFNQSTKQIERGNIKEGIKNIEEFRDYFLINYERILTTKHIENDKQKLMELKNKIDEIISQKFSKIEKWEEKLEKYSENPFYENLSQKISGIDTKIKRYKELLEDYEENLFEEDIGKIINLEHKIIEKIEELETKAIEENKNVIQEKLSNKNLNSVSFEEISTNDLSDSIENLVNEVSYNTLRKWIEKYGKNKLILTILQKKLLKEL